MLVLTRRLNQTILIGDPFAAEPPIEVTVLEVRGEGSHAQVRLGVKAPRAVTVHRSEVYQEVNPQVQQTQTPKR